VGRTITYIRDSTYIIDTLKNEEGVVRLVIYRVNQNGVIDKRSILSSFLSKENFGFAASHAKMYFAGGLEQGSFGTSNGSNASKEICVIDFNTGTDHMEQWMKDGEPLELVKGRINPAVHC
jgi:hypothetical protein